MGTTEYIVRFKGDYSALQKDINKINGETKKLADDEVIIKLNYDGNIKEFNKVFDQISKMHPELGIQFQYNVNEKILRQELDKLEKLSDLKLDIDESKVSGKLKNLADNVESALKEGMSKNEITRRVSEFFGYYNTAIKAGAKNIDNDFDSINNRLYDLFENQAEEIKDIYNEIFDSNDKKKIELFKIDGSLNNDLVKTKERVDDLQNALKGLEEKGASKSGLPSELQRVQDEIKILRADIDSMKGELKNLSGDAFNDMTEQIKGTNEQLNYTLQTLTNLKRALASNDIKIKNSIGGVVKQWQSEEETKSYERYTAFNSQTRETSGAHLAADATGVSMKLMKAAIAELGDDAEGTIHSHPMKNAAFSDDDIERYITLFEESQGKIFLNSITSAEQAMSIDMRKVDISKKGEIVQTIKDSYKAIDDKYLGNLQLSVNEIKEDIMPLLNLKADNPIIGSVIKTIRENFDDLFDGIMNLDEFSDVFEENADYILKQIPELKQLSKEDRNNIMKNVGGYIDLLHDSILGTVSENAQKEYQRVLQEVFAKPEFLKSGETSAIKLEALTDFIDWGSIEDSAIEATKKAGDAVKKAQDSNSPAELTKPLGKDFGEGYAEGIKEAIPDIVDACKQIVLAAYDAVKEASDAKNGEGNNFLDNFINNLKESLDNAAPTIQEKIKEVFSKIDIDNKSEKSSLSSVTSEDFQSQFQNTIDETGEYIIKVYGELIDDFKSRLQNSIDETGIYHVDIEGWLYDSFHDGLQRDIDGQEKYIIEVKGRLFDTFKEVLQEAIDGLGAFPIEVKPYMKKGGEIEEIDLPGGNQNNLSSDSDKIAEQARAEMQAEEAAYDVAQRAKVEAERAGQAIVESQNKAQSEIIDTTTLLRDLSELLHNLNRNNLKTFNSSHGNIFGELDEDNIESVYQHLVMIKNVISKTTRNDYNRGDNIVGGILDDNSLAKYNAYKELLEKIGYTLSEFKKGGMGWQADIIPISDKAIHNGEEMARILFDIQKYEQSPVSTESTNAETKALLSKKEVVEQLRTELNLTKKVAEDVFNEQGYSKTNGKYQIEQVALDELIASLKDKKEIEESEQPTTSPISTAMQEEVSAVDAAIEAEKKKFDELKNKISKTIPNAINKKNDAFKKEAELVSGLVNGEVKDFDKLKQSVDSVTGSAKEGQRAVKDAKSNNKPNESNTETEEERRRASLLQQHYTGLRKDTYQSIGQKSQVQQDMSKYYSELEKESAKAYGNAESKANSLLKKVEKLRESGKYTQDFVTELNTAQAELDSFLKELEAGTIPFEKVGDKVKELSDKIENTLAKKAFNNVKQAAEKTLTNVGLKIDQIIAKNSAMGEDFESRFKALKNKLKDAQSIDAVQKIVAEVNKLESELINAGKTGKSFFDQIKQRLRDINSKYIAQYFSFQDIIRYARQATTNVIELNDAFIELSKVSNTSLKSLEADFQSYASTAKDIGGTITDTINATSDWARMGMINAPLYGDI